MDAKDLVIQKAAALLHTIDTWRETEINFPDRLNGYRLMLSELRHLDELDQLRIAMSRLPRRRQGAVLLNELWAWVVRHADGNEDILNLDEANGGVMIARSRNELERFAEPARAAVRELRVGLQAARFVRSEDKP